MKRIWFVAFLILFPGIAAAACSPDIASLRGDFGYHLFRVEVADDAEERNQGLMFREELAPDSGMLFLYASPHTARFWMKNTLIPLDMLFFDAEGRLSHIHENAVPLDLTGIDGGPGVVAVLEINGGRAAELGIEVGAELRHPHFDPETAAWPCR